MNTFKAKLNKIILGLTSVGLVLLMLPAGLSASHYRYGTISWEIDSDNGTHITIRLKMENGWTANHDNFRESVDYSTTDGLWVSGYIGSVKDNYTMINWGDGDNSSVDMRILSRENTTGTADDNCVQSDNQSLARCKDSTITEMGEYASSTWTTGVTHTYPDNGTTEYVVHWGNNARRPVENYTATDVEWRNETKVNIGGPYDNNTSPVSAVPPVIQVQDNTTFTYQVGATDVNGDNLTYRWGTRAEFFGSSGDFVMPTGMTLSSTGLIEWNVLDNNSAISTVEDDLWVSVIMVEDRHDNGSVKSYVPIDFFFKITAASNDPASLSGIPHETQIVSVGTTKTFTIISTDDSGVAPTITVLNPPSDNSSIWSTTSSTSGGETTFSIIFAPDSSMGGASYVVNIRSTDNAGMTKDQSLGIQVSSVSNAALPLQFFYPPQMVTM